MNTTQPFTAPKEVLELEADARHKADDMRKDIVRVQKEPPLVAIGIPLCPLIIWMFQDSEMNNRTKRKAEAFVHKWGHSTLNLSTDRVSAHSTSRLQVFNALVPTYLQGYLVSGESVGQSPSWFHF